MSDIEKMLDDLCSNMRKGLPVGAPRAAIVAEFERLTKERDAWMDTAATHLTNETFYRDIVQSIGALFPSCYVSDDGSVQDEPLALKVKECVVRELESDKALLAQRDARITNIARIAHDGGLVGLDPYEALDLVRAMSVEHWDRGGSLDDRKGRLSAAILAAREGK